jgi:hypothetical protein
MALNRNLRQDLAYAAYAVALGYTITHSHGEKLNSARFNAGIDHNSHNFHLGDVHVWDTARGWRVAKLVDGHYPKSQDSDFFSDLHLALEAGAVLHKKEEPNAEG